MIKVIIKDKQIKQLDIAGNCADIVTDLAYVVDEVIENISQISEKSKEEVLDILNNSIKKWWLYDKKE